MLGPGDNLLSEGLMMTPKNIAQIYEALKSRKRIVGREKKQEKRDTQGVKNFHE